MNHAKNKEIRSSKWFKLGAIILFIVIVSPVRAQTTVQSMYWIRYYAQFKLGQKSTWHFEADDRFFFGSNEGLQFIMHNHYHYKINPYIDVALGLSYSRVHSSKNQDLVVPEVRPFQEVNVDFFPGQKKHKPVTFRFRLDERFIHENNNYELQPGTRKVMRYRFRLQSAWQVASFNEGKKKLVFKANDEYMVQTGDTQTTFDQNRIYGAFEYSFNPKISLEAGYLNIYQASGETAHFLRHVLRLTVTQRFDLTKKKD